MTDKKVYKIRVYMKWSISYFIIYVSVCLQRMDREREREERERDYRLKLAVSGHPREGSTVLQSVSLTV